MPDPASTAERHASPLADRAAARLSRLGATSANALTALALTAAVVLAGLAVVDDETPRTTAAQARPTRLHLLDLSDRARTASRSTSRTLAATEPPQTATRADQSLDATTYRSAAAVAEAERRARAHARRLARIAAAKAAAEARRVARITAARAAREAARREAAARAAQEAAEEARAAAAQAAAATAPGTLRDMARREMLAFGFGAEQWPSLDRLIMRESGWNPRAANASSGAYGLPQALPGSKMAAVGSDWRTNPVTQVRWMLSYIAGRYGTPQAAWAHSESSGWY